MEDIESFMCEAKFTLHNIQKKINFDHTLTFKNSDCTTDFYCCQENVQESCFTKRFIEYVCSINNNENQNVHILNEINVKESLSNFNDDRLSTISNFKSYIGDTLCHLKLFPF